MGLNRKVRALARKKRAVVSDDPDALISVLQVAKRLIRERAAIEGAPRMSLMEALERAVPMAAAKDDVRTYWSAYRLVFKHAGLAKSSIEILADASKAQGAFNKLVAKGKK